MTKHVTIIKEGKGESLEKAVESAFYGAVGKALDCPRIIGNPAETAIVETVNTHPIGRFEFKDWYIAVIVARFPISARKD